MQAHSKVSFRKWLDLEAKKSKFIETAGGEAFAEEVYVYLSAALDKPTSRLEKMGWKDTVALLYEAYNKFAPPDLPIIKRAPQAGKPVDWDYDNRGWSFYSHILARAYGWTLEYIGDLEVTEALAHIQEILTDEQLEHEFTHSLSEMAYSYNKSSKKSEFRPMKRPYWMTPTIPKTIKRIKMRKDMLPQGLIKDISGLPSEFQIDGLVVEKGW